MTALFSLAAWMASLFLVLVNRQERLLEFWDMGVIHILLSGVLIGLAQWWFLRGKLPGAWWWLIASLVGWVCAGFALKLMTDNSGLEEFARVIVSGRSPAHSWARGLCSSLPVQPGGRPVSGWSLF